jgi:putative colanic acid biosynthesis UDP-glucose lipid carrier transferase
LNPANRLPQPLIPVLIRLLDLLLIALSGWLALHVRRMFDLPVYLPDNLGGYYSLMAAAAMVFLALSRDVYQSWRGAALPLMLARVAGTWALVLGLLLLWLFLVKASEEFSRLWFGLWLLIGTGLLWMERIGVYIVLRLLRKRGYNLKHVALIGHGEVADSLASRLRQAGWTGFHIAHRLDRPDAETLERLAAEPLDEIWLALPLSDEAAIRAALSALRHSTATLRFAPDWFTFRLINHGFSEVVGIPMLDLSASPMTGLNRVVKSLEDTLLALLILLVISPLVPLIAIGVKLDSPGPVFYRQERVGLNGRPFMMLKFRSMPEDVEAEGVRWGGSRRKSTTRFGAFLRRTSLDELPQFINVLRGDMSIVGPRPERPMFVEQFKDEIPDYMRKHLVKAGITGWAQIHGWRGDTDLRARIEHDLYYIENWSLWLDLKIMLLTLFRGFRHQNAY